MKASAASTKVDVAYQLPAITSEHSDSSSAEAFKSALHLQAKNKQAYCCMNPELASFVDGNALS